MASLFRSHFFKFVYRTVFVVAGIWSLVLAGRQIYDFAYENAYKAFEQQVTYLKMKIEDLEEMAAAGSVKVDTLTARNTQLTQALGRLRATRIVLRDTIIYEGEGVTILDGKVSISCEMVRTEGGEFGADRFANICIRSIPIEDVIRGGGTYRPGGLGQFQYKKQKYILAVLGCREYEKGRGVKIAVYKGK